MRGLGRVRKRHKASETDRSEKTYTIRFLHEYNRSGKSLRVCYSAAERCDVVGLICYIEDRVGSVCSERT